MPKATKNQKKIVSKEIKSCTKKGKPRKQCIAIGLSKAGLSKKKKSR